MPYGRHEKEKEKSMKRCAIAVSALVAIIAALSAAPAAAQTASSAQTAEGILARLDSNESFKSISYSGRIEITIGGQTRYKTMDSIAQGSEKAFTEFTNPEDRGTRYLKLGKELWIYFPKEQDSVKISGHLLKDGVMGSDLSYEDALESQDFAAKYSAALKGRENLDGRECYVIELTAKTASAAYDRRVLWIDAERYVGLKEEMYARSGKLLKESRALEVAKIGDRWYPSKTQFVSKLRANTRTVFSMTKIELDAQVDPRKFTMAALTR
jgi:outer membrane lipoprotein-sorting protein